MKRIYVRVALLATSMAALLLAGGAGLPYDPEPDLAENALLIEDHLAHDKAQR